MLVVAAVAVVVVAAAAVVVVAGVVVVVGSVAVGAAGVSVAEGAGCVCNFLFLYRYMRPKGLGSSGSYMTISLPQIETTDPSRVPLPPSPHRPPDRGKEI